MSLSVVFSEKVKCREFLIIKKSKNYYSVSYYDYSDLHCNNAKEIEITSATSKSKAKKKLKLIVKSYKLGFSDGWN